MLSKQDRITLLLDALAEKQTSEDLYKVLYFETITTEEYTALIEEARAIQLAKTKRNMSLWAGMAVFVLAMLFELVGTRVAIKYPILVAVAGVVLIVAGVLKSYFAYLHVKWLQNPEQEAGGVLVPALTGLGAVPLIILFLFLYTEAEGDILKEKGITTTGVVLYGEALESRRGGIYKVYVAFAGTQGDTIKVSTTVSENQFNEMHKGQQVEVTYLEEDPDVIRIR